MCVGTDNLSKRQVTWIGCCSHRGAIGEYDSRQRVGTTIHATSFRRVSVAGVCKINGDFLQTSSIFLHSLMYLRAYKTLLVLQL